MVLSIDVHRPTQSEECSLKLKNDDGLRTMFSIFNQHNNKGLIELDASLVIFVEEIQKNLINLGNLNVYFVFYFAILSP